MNNNSSANDWVWPSQWDLPKKITIDVKDKEKAWVTGIIRAYAEEMSNYLAVGNSEVSNTWQQRNKLSGKNSTSSDTQACEIVNGVTGLHLQDHRNKSVSLAQVYGHIWSIKRRLITKQITDSNCRRIHYNNNNNIAFFPKQVGVG